MDQKIPSRRISSRDGADPQLPNYMRASGNAVMGQASNRTVTVRSNQRPASSQTNYRSGNGSRSGGGNGNGNGGGSRSGNGKSPRKKRPTRAQRLLRLAVGVLAVLLVVVGILLLVTKCNARDNDPSAIAEFANKTYFDGVSIAGIDMSGKSIEQARGALQSHISDTLNQISITMTDDDGSWSFTSADMAIAANTEDVLLEAMGFGRNGTFSENADAKELLKTTGKDFPLTFTPSRSALENKLNSIAESLNKAAVEPQMTGKLNDKNKPVFTLQEGRMLNTVATADAIAALVEQGQYQAGVDPVFDTLTPTMDTAGLEKNTVHRGTFSTNYSANSEETTQNRVFNIHKAGDIINGLVLQPGKEWSFNDYVGLRTERDGWKVANGISGGKEYTPQVGGGICQVSTTLYNALLYANIEITTRKAHSIPSNYVPEGLDATVDSSGIDLRFKNNTNAPLYVFVYYTKPKSRREEIHVMVYGEPLPEGVTYKSSNEILSQEPNTDIVYIDDASVPYGYELTKIESRPRIEAAAYHDKYVDGKLEDHKLLYKDTYRGNKTEILIGTGNPFTTAVPQNARRASVKPKEMPSSYDPTWESGYVAPQVPDTQPDDDQ